MAWNLRKGMNSKVIFLFPFRSANVAASACFFPRYQSIRIQRPGTRIKVAQHFDMCQM